MKQVLGQEALHIVAPIFDGWDETFIWSTLEGCMGSVWIADHDEKPKAAASYIGDLLLLAGDAKSAEALSLIHDLRDMLGERNTIIVPQNQMWEALIRQVFGEKAVQGERYAFHKSMDGFDPKRLKEYVNRLPEGIELRRIDRELYHRALQEEWSSDFCSQFGSAEEYQAHGLGVVALKDDSIVGGASSYIYYRGGIEIQVDTREDMRRQGIAMACSAALILECLERGLYPSWDAAHRFSAHMAEKLGYQEKGAYVFFELNPEA